MFDQNLFREVPQGDYEFIIDFYSVFNIAVIINAWCYPMTFSSADFAESGVIILSVLSHNCI